ncbi:MAG: DUF512 domain-containing protein [Lachnospiraceae bacterium]|nr:DUF512 domain-containing protein [Lachnospiraceae bacterium]
MTRHQITGIKPGSIAEELNIQAGDSILSISGQNIEDVFDYEFLCRDEYLELLIETKAGEQILFEIEKEEDEDLGLEFGEGLMDRYRSCRNKCVFCFIDQMPPGMRETLYFKDDDARLSFLQGNYVTLTNMDDHDIARIIRYRLSPINISIHTMNPDLRCRMLNNRFAGIALQKLDRLYEAGLTMNGQIVLCPGWNDGAELDFTIRELSKYLPVMESVSVVPVGLTRFREKLTPLRLLTKEEAVQTVELIEKWQRELFPKYGLHFIHASDEIYLKAELPLPEEERYDGYLQLENGVGMLRLFIDQFREELSHHRRSQKKREISLACGELPAPTLQMLLNELCQKFPGITAHLYPIKNRFFGESITVSGLVTGQDLIAQLKGKPLGETLYLPDSMLRAGEDVFLDDIHAGRIEEVLNVTVTALECNGASLVKSILQSAGKPAAKRLFRAYEPGGKV